jgi:TonB family protein
MQRDARREASMGLFRRVVCLAAAIGLLSVGCKSDPPRRGKARSGAAEQPDKARMSASSSDPEQDRLNRLVREELRKTRAAEAMTAPKAPAGAGPNDRDFTPTPPVLRSRPTTKSDFAKFEYRGPQVFVTKPKVMGSIDAATIRRVMRRRVPSLNRCYVTLGLAKNPKLAGTVTVAFGISSEGRITPVKIVSTTLNHPSMESCVKSVIERARFPRPDGRLPEVVYPIHFKVFPTK